MHKSKSDSPIYSTRSPTRSKKEMKRVISQRNEIDESTDFNLSKDLIAVDSLCAGVYREDSFYPFACNHYDQYIIKRLRLQLDVDIDVLSPQRLFILFSRDDRFGAYQTRFNSFLDRNVSMQAQSWISMHRPNELLVFLAYVSNFTAPVILELQSRNIYNSCVGSLLSLLTEKRDSSILTTAIACLAYIVEKHPSAGSVLTEPNISQLIKLCLARAIYPGNGIGGTDQLTQAMEAGVSRLALSRLMQIDLVQQSSCANKELGSFVSKWWQRMRLSVEQPGQSGSYDMPGNESSSVPVLRHVLEIVSDILERFPAIRTHIATNCENNNSSCNFLTNYISCKDGRAVLATVRIINFLVPVCTSNDILDVCELSSIVIRRISRLAAKPLPDVDSVIATPPGEFLVPRKRSVSSAARLPFRDVTNNNFIEKSCSPLNKSKCLYKTILPQQSGYSEPATSLESDTLRSLLLEYLIAELFKLLDILSSTSELQTSGCRLVDLPLRCAGETDNLFGITRASVILFNVLSQVETIGAPALSLVPLLLKGIVSSLKCLNFFNRTVAVLNKLNLSVFNEYADVVRKYIILDSIDIDESCRNFLLSYLPHIEVVEIKESTAVCETDSKLRLCEKSMGETVVSAFPLSVEDTILEYKLQATLTELEKINADLRAAKEEAFTAKRRANEFESKVAAQDDLLQDMYLKLQSVSRSEYVLRNDVEQLKLSTLLENEAATLANDLSFKLRLEVAEKEAISAFYCSKNVGLQEQVLDLQTRLDLSLEQVSSASCQVSVLTDEISVKNLAITTLEDRYRELNGLHQLKCDAESKLLMENLNLQRLTQETMEQLVKERSDLEEARQTIIVKDKLIEDLKDQLASQNIVAEDLACELTKQKELLLFISKISLQNSEQLAAAPTNS